MWHKTQRNLHDGAIIIIEFEADPKVVATLQALDIELSVVEPANGSAGWMAFAMTPELDQALVDLIDRFVDIRLAYIDDRQRQYGEQLPLPLDDGAGDR